MSLCCVPIDFFLTSEQRYLKYSPRGLLFTYLIKNFNSWLVFCKIDMITDNKVYSIHKYVVLLKNIKNYKY